MKGDHELHSGSEACQNQVCESSRERQILELDVNDSVNWIHYLVQYVSLGVPGSEACVVGWRSSGSAPGFQHCAKLPCAESWHLGKENNKTREPS